MGVHSLTVEQAVFSVKLGVSSNSTTLRNATDGVSDEELAFAMRLAERVVSLGGRYDPNNMFMFPLGKDTILLGRLTPQGPMSNEGPFYLECLFFDYEVFCNAGLDPVRFLHLALNTTRFALYREETELQTFTIEQSSGAFINVDSVHVAVSRAGLKAPAVLIQSMLEREQTAFVSRFPTQAFISTIFSLLPLQFRDRFNFSTGLFFRDVEVDLIGATAFGNVPFLFPKSLPSGACLNLDDVKLHEEKYFLTHPWAVMLDWALKSDALPFLHSKMARDYLAGYRENEDARALGKEWLDDLFEAENNGSLDDPETIDDFQSRDALEGDEEAERRAPWGILNQWNKEEEEHDGEEWKTSDDDRRDEWDAIANSLAGPREVEPDMSHSIQIVQVDDSDVSSESASSDDRSPSMSIGDDSDDLSSDETFEEQLRRRLSERDRKNEKKAGSFENETPSDSVTEGGLSSIALSPFVILSAEFPHKSVLLRRLDELVRSVCRREFNSQVELELHWKRLEAEPDRLFVERVREEYLFFLNRLISKDVDPEENCNLTVGALDVLDVLSPGNDSDE